jgi:hypothetical protein
MAYLDPNTQKSSNNINTHSRVLFADYLAYLMLQDLMELE